MKANIIKNLAVTAILSSSFFLLHSASADAVPARAYVQDGLVVCFDGIENAGAGQHSSDLTEWVNLATADGRCGNAYPSDGSYTVKADSISFVKGRMVASNLVCATSSTPITLQARARATSAPSTAYDLMYVNVSSRGGVGFDARTNYGYSYYQPKNSSWGSQTSIYKWWGTFNFAARAYGKHTVTAIIPVSSDKTASVGKVYQENSVQAMFSSWESEVRAAPNGNVYVGHTGVDYEMYSVRIYNRELTTAEIAYNELVDRIRFENLAGYRWNSETSKLECRVSFVASDADRGSVAATVGGNPATPPFWTQMDDEVTLTPTPAGGYKFVRWIGDTDSVAVDANGVATFSGAARDLTAVFVSESADPQDRSWSGAGDTKSWSDPANWTPAGVPAEGDFVTIGSGKSIVLTNSTAELSTLSIASTLSCSNWTTCIRAGDVKLLSGAKIQPIRSFSNSQMSNRVWIVAGTLNIASGASINANLLGYSGGNGPCWKVVARSGHQAGSYGGYASGGGTYGSVTEPEDPGSGGDDAAGGAIRLDVARSLVVNGTITATGGGGGYWNAGGSGGGVWITCGTISGKGAVHASAGNYTDNSADYYNGGGGRIAVHYDPAAQDGVDPCLVRFNANGAVRKSNATDGARCIRVSGAGSLYFTDDRFLKRQKVDLCGVVWCDEGGTPVRPSEYVFAAGQDLANSKLEFPLDDTVVTVNGDLSLTGTVTRAYGFRFTGFRAKLDVKGDVYMKGAAIEATKGLNLDVGGDLTQASGTINGTAADVRITAGPTNTVVTTYGGEVDVRGKWTIGGNGYLAPGCCSTNGSIVALHAGSFQLDATGVINANGLGWNKANVTGWPGNWARGAAHGGRGGYNNMPVAFYGTRYDNERNPLMPGAGGRNSNNNPLYPGGGVVYLKTEGNMTINGSITANGTQQSAWAGSGAGGSVNLVCGHKLFGSGSIAAKGGNRNTSGDNSKKGGADGGAGGGGRIAVYCEALAAEQSVLDHLSVAGGTGTTIGEDYFGYGEDGTIYVHHVHGTVLIMR